jgi:hypothetical protein
MEEITALASQHPNIPQVRALLLRKRINAGKEFPVDFMDTNYYYPSNQHFINDVFKIELPTKKLKDIDKKPSVVSEQLSDINTVDKSVGIVDNNVIPPEISRDDKAESMVDSDKGNKIDEVEEMNKQQSANPSRQLYERLEASPYATWLLSLKQTNPLATSQERTKSIQQDQLEETLQENTDSNSPPDVAVKELSKEDPEKRLTDESSTLNKEIASESLAELLAKQGHQTKAIDMYEKLSLIFPEKRAYFASQIKKIKRK